MPSTYEEPAPGDETTGDTRSGAIGDTVNDVADAGRENEFPGRPADIDYDGVEPHHNLD
ncbi:hypothetical protein [Kitasatospora sp. GP82]|uniref:hypothetical protein n=1 Tax=Kitasatospora sp. GP82 TaxID=3035089 RepID=UPI0024742ACC|nr:hypothetical protein [Kitasatospora sp. GP82]MDH6126847.1 hypothetical protein [Kitasatospora sp. GP82]